MESSKVEVAVLFGLGAWTVELPRLQTGNTVVHRRVDCISRVYFGANGVSRFYFYFVRLQKKLQDKQPFCISSSDSFNRPSTQ